MKKYFHLESRDFRNIRRENTCVYSFNCMILYYIHIHAYWNTIIINLNILIRGRFKSELLILLLNIESNIVTLTVYL